MTLLAFLFATLASLVTTPVILHLARRFGFIDDPQKHMHPAIVHSRPTPRAGGIPIYLGVLIPTLLLLPLTPQLIAILVAGLGIVVVGTLDDKYDLSPYIRFATNIGAALIVIASGIGITFITNPFGGILNLTAVPIRIGELVVALPLSNLFTLLWIPWVMNMVNWSKGVDGQMPMVVIVAALTIGMLALRTVANEPAQAATAVLAFSLAGATLGFLAFNWHPAKMFPGYGATITGFMLAVLSIYGSSKVATALLVLGVPSVDAVFTIARRIIAGKNPFLGDREHLHHRLLDLGWSHQRIALFYFTFCAILGLAALSLSSQGKVFAVMLVAAVVGGGLLWLRSALDSSKAFDPDNG